MKSVVWLVCFFLTTLLSHAQPPSGYHLVFDEEFNALSVSEWGALPLRTWIAHTPYSGDFGAAWFGTGPQLSVYNGTLSIKAFYDRSAGHWRSGLIASVDTHGNGFAQALGYWECRMKWMGGLGTWPAFWLNSVNTLERSARTSNSCEVDILEAYGINTWIAHQHVHIWSPKGNQVGGSANQVTWNLTNRSHVFGCLIKRDFITFTIDGFVIFVTPTPPEALAPMYCMLDLALGGGWPIDKTPDPSFLYVDYVRCYAP